MTTNHTDGLDAAGVAVRPLQWTEDRDDDGTEIHRASAREVNLPYTIYEDGFTAKPFGLSLNQLRIGSFDTVPEAKAAAQLDFATRVRSALVDAPAGERETADPSFPDALPDNQIRIWIDACNHEPARQALRQLLAYRIRGVSTPLLASPTPSEAALQAEPASAALLPPDTEGEAQPVAEALRLLDQPLTYDWNGHKDMEVQSPEQPDGMVAGRVRMLMRDQLNHEEICTLARDRIMGLSKRLAGVRSLLTAALSSVPGKGA